jgi:ferrous iron transport protein B
VDSTVLKRSLVLLAQVMQTGARVVLALNMSDEAQQSGQRLGLDQMQALLGIPVVETVGNRGTGADKLLDAIRSAASAPATKSRLVLGERLEAAITAVRAKLGNSVFKPALHDWVATKLIAGEQSFLDAVESGHEGQAAEEARRQRHKLESETGIDISLFITERYFGFVDGLLKEVMLHGPRQDARRASAIVDSVLVNRALGLPLFAVVMFSVFWVTFTLGEAPMSWIESGFSLLGDWISGIWPPGSESPLRSFLVDGIIGGVGAVIVFLPNIVLLFLGLAILEDTGYMARAAFLMDRVMHRFGLHGKSFLPMLTGFGCSVPGIMATRTLENERDRLTTMLVLPLMSCGARLPIWMLLIPAFFAPTWRAPMLWVIYATGIVLALFFSLILRRTVFKGEDAPFVMELPPYRLPTLKAVWLKMIERSWCYLRKAGTVILGISILLWAITAYPKKEQYDVDAQVAAGELRLSTDEIERARAVEDLRYSIAGRIGGFIEPVIRPLGFDWKLGTAMIGAFAAKEVFVSQVGIVYSMSETDEEPVSLRAALARDYSPLVGLSLMLFLLISAPCMATIAVTRQESGRWKWALLQLGGLTAIAYLVSLIVYQFGQMVT